MNYLKTYKLFENNGDVITFINSNLYLVNVSNEEYKSLIEIFNENNLDKQVTKHFINQ